MKKTILMIAFALTVFSTATFAQHSANLNITLSDFISFSVTQPAELTVDFNSETKYTNGITALAADHITVVSSKGYVVKAIAGTITGTSSLDAGSVKLTSSVGSTNQGNTADITYQSDVALPASGGTEATIITSGQTSWSGTNSANKFNISYLIGAGGAYAGKTVGADNVIPVIYTVTQP